MTPRTAELLGELESYHDRSIAYVICLSLSASGDPPSLSWSYAAEDRRLARTREAYQRWQQEMEKTRGLNFERMSRETKPPKRLQGQFGSRKLMSPVKPRDKKKMHLNQVQKKSMRSHNHFKRFKNK